MISKRKQEHIDICLKHNVSAGHNYWDDINLIHRALPEINFADIELRSGAFGIELNAPLIISAMTGGCESALKINRNLAKAAAESGIGMGVGSQRPAIEDKNLEQTYSVVKDYDVPLVIANLGAPQLIGQGGKRKAGIMEARKAMEMIDADFLAIHLNFLQEVVQGEGEKDAVGCLDAVETLAAQLPVIVKETGAGLSREIALELRKRGVKGLDIGGLGGTSFAAVEHFRAKKKGLKGNERLGRTFWNWGIPAPVSTVECQVGLPLIATGGIRNGLDAAKALALGANVVGMAGALLKAANESAEATIAELDSITQELKAAMFLTGSSSVEELRKRDYVVSGELRHWLEQRREKHGTEKIS